jgi:hypothetical protein
MIMAWQGADILILIGRVPQFDGQIGRTGGKESATSRSTVIHIKNRPRVAFDCPFQFTQFPVPDFDRGIF